MDRLQAKLPISVMAQAVLAALLIFLFTSSTPAALFQTILVIGLHGLAQEGLGRWLEAPLEEKRSTWWMAKAMTMRSLVFGIFMVLVHSISQPSVNADLAVLSADFLKISLIMGCGCLAIIFIVSRIYRSRPETRV